MDYTYSTSEAIPQWDLAPEYPDVIRRSHLETLAELGALGVEHLLPRQTPRVARQTVEARENIVSRARDGLGAVVQAELEAGHAARQEIDADRRLYAVAGAAKDRRAVELRCLGQRNALLRVFQVQSGEEHVHVETPNVARFLDIVLALSANAAALSGSRWTSTQTWMERNLALLTAEMGTDQIKAAFDNHLARANSVLAATVATRLADYRTAPSPQDIAEAMGITTRVLRIARANQVGLTSIDPESKRERDRRCAEAKRRARGMAPQATRTRCADDIALAAEIGVNEKTIRRWREKGSLDNELEKRRVAVSDVQKVSSG